MMKVKTKPGKGIGKCHGIKGCGKPSTKRKFGLCPACLWEWMCTNDNGKVWRETQFLPRVKKKTEREVKKRNREQKEKTKIELMSSDKYRAKYVQPIINKIARQIDYGHPCIATGNFGKMNGGHYISVGANRTTCVNLHNIFIQSFESNHHRSGDTLKYQRGLREVFGQKYFDFIESLKGTPPINFTKQDFIELKERAKYVLETIEKDLKIRTPLERIRLRDWSNRRLTVYNDEQAYFFK